MEKENQGLSSTTDGSMSCEARGMERGMIKVATGE